MKKEAALNNISTVAFVVFAILFLSEVYLTQVLTNLTVLPSVMECYRLKADS